MGICRRQGLHTSYHDKFAPSQELFTTCLLIPISVHAVDESIPIDQFPPFFEDSRLNFAENLLSGNDSDVAIIDMGEDNIWTPRRITWKELRQLVAKYAEALRAAGLKKGDVLARTFLPLQRLVLAHSSW